MVWLLPDRICVSDGHISASAVLSCECSLLLWLQQVVQCGELMRSDHRLDHANVIISYDFFSLPNCGSFLDLSGLHVSAFSALLVPVSCGGENVADLFFKFHD